MQFCGYGPRSVLAAFDGGEMTSDAGALLLCEMAEQLNLFTRLADCFDDHETLRHDPLLKLATSAKAKHGNVMPPL